MDIFYKFSLASNLYDGLALRNNYAKINEVTAYLTEENVKKSYELIFGLNTYKFKLSDDGFYYYQGFERTKK